MANYEYLDSTGERYVYDPRTAWDASFDEEAEDDGNI